MPTNPVKPPSKTAIAKKRIDPWLPVVALVAFCLGGAVAQVAIMPGLALAGIGGFVLGRLYR